MAIPADTVWEVQTTGNDANGAGWAASKAGGTGVDMSQGAPTVFGATLSATGTTTLTDSANGFTNLMLGNVIQITGQGFYCISTYVGPGSVTVDRALGTFSTTSGRVGGPVAFPATIGAIVVAGNVVFVKSGSYTITTATANVSGGCVSTAVSSLWVGYDTTRTTPNSDTNLPALTLNSGVSSAVLLTVTGVIKGLSLNGAGQTNSRGTVTATNIGCKFSNFTNNAANSPSLSCEITGCTTQPAMTGNCYACVAHGNSVTSFTGTAVNCIAYANTSTPFTCNTGIVVNCVAYGNTGGTTDGFTPGNSNAGADFVNCIAESNGRYGFNGNTTTPVHFLYNCSAKNNASGATNPTVQNIGFITPGGTVFVDPTNQDFRLNNTAGAGALLRAAGFPSTWPAVNAAMLNYLDIGVAQHQDSGGGTVIVIED